MSLLIVAAIAAAFALPHVFPTCTIAMVDGISIASFRIGALRLTGHGCIAMYIQAMTTRTQLSAAGDC